MVETIAPLAFSKFTVYPGSFNGLAGIGEFFCDAHRALGDPNYLHAAYEVAESITHFSVRRRDGLVFPGRNLTRLSTDYAFGSSGIGHFFHRLHTASPRFMHDVIAR
jgi:hypothetical protein